MRTLVVSVLVSVLFACIVGAATPACADLLDDIYVDIVPATGTALDVEPCTWYELDTFGPTFSWLIHVAGDVPVGDMTVSMWDADQLVMAGTTPFASSYSTCTYDELGGPPGGRVQTYWQTVHLWDGYLEPGTTWQLSVSWPPYDAADHRSDVWIHPSPVPEPGTLALLACGGAGLLPILRRRRRS